MNTQDLIRAAVLDLLNAWHDPDSGQQFDKAICQLQRLVDYPIQCDKKYEAKLAQDTERRA